MNRKAMARLVLGTCVLGWPLALGLAGCGGQAEPLMGTETGNPPDVDMRRLRLEWTPSGVKLIGAPGAVPAGSEVALRNSRTGETATGTAAADGSIRLSVPGDLSDPYEVTVSSGGGQTKAPLSATDGTMPGSTLDDGTLPGGMLACSNLEAQLYQTVADTFTQAPRACSADSDCSQQFWGVDCYYGCGVSTIAASAVNATRALAEERVGPICADLAGCNREGAPSCPPSPLSVATCIDGGCQNLALDQLSCQELGNQASLRRIGAMENGDRACNVDADCALVSFGVSCFADCGVNYAVAGSAVQRVQSDVETIESQFCGQFDAAGCPDPVDPPCVPPDGVPTAMCNPSSNLCEVQFAMLVP